MLTYESALLQRRLDQNIAEAAELISFVFDYDGVDKLRLRDVGMSCFMVCHITSRLSSRADLRETRTGLCTPLDCRI